VIVVCIVHPNGQRQEVLLAGTPRRGDHIRLSEGSPTEPSLVVEQVLWQEARKGQLEPYVIIVVRPHAVGPDV